MRSQGKVAMLLFTFLALSSSDRTAFSDPSKEKYVFIEDTSRWVAVIRPKLYLIGRLDQNGDFIHEYKFEGRPAMLNLGFPPPPVINRTGEKPKKVYEFRSGVLVPGEIQPDGRFVPEAGGKIIPFKDYQYSPTATPIWNLPGAFLTEAEAAKLKRPKPDEKK